MHRVREGERELPKLGRFTRAFHEDVHEREVNRTAAHIPFQAAFERDLLACGGGTGRPSRVDW